jgi:hypothetical protein
MTPYSPDEPGSFPRDKLIRLLGCAEDHSALVRQASLLPGGDFAAAGAVPQDSFGALRDAWMRLGDLSKARLYLCQAVVSRSRSGVGTLRTLAAAAKIVEALGLAIDLTEVGPKS